MRVLLVLDADTHRSVSIEQAIPAVEDSFTELAAGEVNLPPVMSLEMTQAGGKLAGPAGPA
jgi:hypothetical protein